MGKRANRMLARRCRDALVQTLLQTEFILIPHLFAGSLHCSNTEAKRWQLVRASDLSILLSFSFDLPPPKHLRQDLRLFAAPDAALDLGAPL